MGHPKPICHAGIGILLLDERRHAHALGGPQHGRAGIAAESHDGIGAEVADGLAGPADAAPYLERYQQVAPLQTALQARDWEPDDAVTQGGDLLHLHLALGSHEKEFDPVAQTAFERFGDRYGRVDVAARTAARENDMFRLHDHNAISIGSPENRGFLPNARSRKIFTRAGKGYVGSVSCSIFPSSRGRATGS